MAIPKRVLGRTGLSVSSVAFGAGPVSGLMTGHDEEKQQLVIDAAIEAGINWFDTAPGYGQGRSESNLGRALSRYQATSPVHLATKVRIPLDLTEPVSDFVKRSVEASLMRLCTDRVTLLQLHNGITSRTGEEPDSIGVDQVLSHGGVLDAMEKVRDTGLVQYLGMTGTGHSVAMRAVVQTSRLDTIQIPYNLLNPSAGEHIQFQDDRINYGHLIADCANQQMGVFAIRVFAGGALFDRHPSEHTRTTRYFPLSLYEKDLERAAEIRRTLRPDERLARYALRFVLDHPAITAAIIGFGAVDEVHELV